MAFFSRRNEYVTEYSGHEEVSSSLRNRIESIIRKFVRTNAISHVDRLPWFIAPDRFQHLVYSEFPERDAFDLIKNGDFRFSIVP